MLDKRSADHAYEHLRTRSVMRRIHHAWDECPNVSAGRDDPSGGLRMQPVTCCLSVTKPVKGELIIPAG